MDEALTVDMYAFETTAGPASATTMFLAIYALDDDFQPTGNAIGATSQTIGTSAIAVFNTQITPVTLQPGAYAIAHNNGQTMTLRAVPAGFLFMRGLMGSGGQLNYIRQSRTAGSFPNNPVAWNNPTHSSVAPLVDIFLRWKAA